ncbi:hsp70 family protein, partial [Vibrio parahaemolyticus VP2007-007]
CLVQR